MDSSVMHVNKGKAYGRQGKATEDTQNQTFFKITLKLNKTINKK